MLCYTVCFDEGASSTIIPLHPAKPAWHRRDPRLGSFLPGFPRKAASQSLRHSNTFQALLTVLLSPVCSYYTSDAKVKPDKIRFSHFLLFCSVSGSTGLFARGSSARPLLSWRLRGHKDGQQLCTDPQSATGVFLFLL